MVYCPNEGCQSTKDYTRIGRHFASCGHPSFSDQQKSILTGLLMGDATVPSDKGNLKLELYSTNKEFLNYLIIYLPDWVTTTSKAELHKSSEVAQDNGEKFVSQRGYDGDDYDFSPVYRIRTIRHPFMNELRDWYGGGKKELPSTFSPTALKYWYVCDGNLRKEGGNRYAKIAAYSQRGSRLSLLGGQIEDLIGSGVSVNRDNGIISMGSESTENFLSTIGEPVEGFEYKW